MRKRRRQGNKKKKMANVKGHYRKVGRKRVHVKGHRRDL